MIERLFAGNFGKGVKNSTGKASITSSIYDTGEREGRDSPIIANWYKQKPYAFKFRDNTFYLPIAPSNIAINTHFATNMISTMYGTVEEHSEQRYYDISISGTTGMSPKYYKQIEQQRNDLTGVVGRALMPLNNRVTSGFSGFFKRTKALAENALNQAADIIEEQQPSNGVDVERSGYVAFHNFYKFLLLYKKDISNEIKLSGSGERNLRFINYKDNNQYNVVINNFQLTRDASDPMLYNYSISMRAYNIRTADSPILDLDLADRATQLGLDGLDGSLFAKVANGASKAKNVAYSTVAFVKGFGS
jgi:hypothetical protein